MIEQPSERVDLTAHDHPPAGPVPAPAGSTRTWTPGSGLDGLDERIEFAGGPDAVLVRDPRYPEGPHLRFSPEQWTALLTAPLPAADIIDARDRADLVDARDPRPVLDVRESTPQTSP